MSLAVGLHASDRIICSGSPPVLAIFDLLWAGQLIISRVLIGTGAPQCGGKLLQCCLYAAVFWTENLCCLSRHASAAVLPPAGYQDNCGKREPHRDRCALLALLKLKGAEHSADWYSGHILVVSTHLARNPESEVQVRNPFPQRRVQRLTPSRAGDQYVAAICGPTSAVHLFT